MNSNSSKTKKYKCPFVGCGSSYNKKSDLNSHLKKHNRSRGNHVCVICKCVFLKKSQLRKHVSVTHKNNIKRDGTTVEAVEAILTCEPHECEICNKRFTKKSSLDKHLKRHDKKPFKCLNSECGQSFSFFKDFKKHSKIHSQNVECDICKKVLKNKTRLQTHMRDVHCDKRFECEFCNKSYKSKRNLNKHVNRKHSRIEKFFCKDCIKEFEDRGVLKRHFVQFHVYSKERVELEFQIIDKENETRVRKSLIKGKKPIDYLKIPKLRHVKTKVNNDEIFFNKFLGLARN